MPWGSYRVRGVVRAIQYTEDNAPGIHALLQELGTNFIARPEIQILVIRKNGRTIYVEKDHWIIGLSDGEWATCLPEEFDEIYELEKSNA